MAKFKVGDKVVTQYGEGKIVEYDRNANNFLVYHDDWSRGHNGYEKYKGNHCWWFEESMLSLKENSNCSLPEIKRYIINENATIIFWEDGEKTIVKRCSDEPFKKELGFLYAYFQKTSGLSKTKANKFIKELRVENEKVIKNNKTKKESFLEKKFSSNEPKSKFEIGDVVNVKYKENKPSLYEIRSLFDETSDIEPYIDRRSNRTQIRYKIIDKKYDGKEWIYIIESRTGKKRKYAFKETALRIKVEFNG